MNKRFSVIVVSILVAIHASCNGQGTNPMGAFSQDQYSASSSIDDIARFFSGREVPESSSLHKHTTSRYYTRYRKQIKKAWKRFQASNLARIKKWWAPHRPSRSEKSVLYPFSGPDINNALTFFPDADQYILFGLEKPGLIPNPALMSSKEIIHGLGGLKQSLNTILRVNFFRTKSMAVETGENAFNSIAGIMLYMLSSNGYVIIDGRRIIINRSSQVTNATTSDLNASWKHPRESRIPGVEIRFRKENSRRIQTVRYYMLNVADQALEKQTPNFIPYMALQGPYSTVIKSASYLMHNRDRKFTTIRSAILKYSTFIVQDDTGIPLDYLVREKWNIRVHGIYEKPIPLFSHRFQKDLKELMKKESTGVLPFSYGYDYKRGKANLITAEK